MAAESAVHGGVDPASLMVGRRGWIGMRDGVCGVVGLGMWKPRVCRWFQCGLCWEYEAEPRMSLSGIQL